MALPTIAQDAPYTWVASADANGNPLATPPSGGSGDGLTASSVPLNGILLFNGTTFDRWNNAAGAGNANILANKLAAEAPNLFNGTNYDAQRNNLDVGAIITATGVTTTQTSANQFNLNGRGVKIVLNMTSIGTGSVTLHIQGFDSGGGVFYDQLVGAAVVTNSVNIYTVYPGLANSANVSANDIIPRTWRIQVVANNANATTYTVSAVTLL